MDDVWRDEQERARFLIALHYLKASPEWRRVVGIHGGCFNIKPDLVVQDKEECENSNETYVMKAKLHYAERFSFRVKEVVQRSKVLSEGVPGLAFEARAVEDAFKPIEAALCKLDVSGVQQDFEKLKKTVHHMKDTLKGLQVRTQASSLLQGDLWGIIDGIDFAYPEKNWNDMNRWGGYVFCSHGLVTFPIWHRPYVAEFETLLQKFDPAKKGHGNRDSLALPYWHWDPSPKKLPEWATQERVDLKYLDIDLGHVENPLYRGLQSSPKKLPKPTSTYTYTVNNDPTTRDFHTKHRSGEDEGENMFPDVMESYYYHYMLLAKPWDQVATTDYGGPFNMEQPHNMLHESTGGDMGRITTSSWDPIFFLHRCNVERMFTAWQLKHPSETLPKELSNWRLHPFPSPVNEYKQRAWWPKPGQGPSPPGTAAEVQARVGLATDWFRLSALWYTYDSYEIGNFWEPPVATLALVVLVATLNRPRGDGRISVRDPTGKEVAAHVTLSAGWDGPGGEAEAATCANCVLRSSATLGFDVSSHLYAATLLELQDHGALATAFQIVWCPCGGAEQPLDTAGMSLSMRKA